MIERGSGRTSGLTDWQLMDVLSMWACVQDQDTTGQWKQVAGWRKICDLALAHLSRLREYRRGLAEAWPPATNAAARAYLAELDQLIDKVQRTHDAAAANYDALAAATRALASARAGLKPLRDEYAAKLQQKRAYEEILADPKAVAGSRLPSTPPVRDADLEELNGRARGLMAGLSGELQQAQTMLRQPPPKPNIPRQPDEPDRSGSPGSTPVIPPIVPVTPIVESPSTRRHVTAARPMPEARLASGTGPILGGAGPAVVPASTSPAPGHALPLPFGHSPGPSFPPPLNHPPVAPVAPARPELRAGQIGPLGPTSGGAAGPTSPTSRPLPPGGVIGGVPNGGVGQPASRGSAPRRVNPVGGVIGGGGAGTTPSGSAGSRPGSGRASHLAAHGGYSPIGGSPGVGTARDSGEFPERARGSLRGDQRSRAWDPDEPWEVDQGVNPVMRSPNEDGPVDPGPAIGLDR